MTTKLGTWSIKFDCVLDGKEVNFDELSASTQETILDNIKQGYYSGEIVEEDLTAYNCPHCGSENTSWMGDAYEDNDSNAYYCHDCDRWFNVEE